MKVLPFIAICVGYFMVLLDTTIVNVAGPTFNESSVPIPCTMILTRLELCAKDSLRMSRVVGEKRFWHSEWS